MVFVRRVRQNGSNSGFGALSLQSRAPDPARAQAPPVDALRWELKVLASAALR